MARKKASGGGATVGGVSATIGSRYGQFGAYAKRWTMINDLLDGEDAVKAAGETYVSALGGQSTPEYEEYVGRGMLFGAFARTVQGLSGAIMRKEPIVEGLHGDLLPVMEHFTTEGDTFYEVAQKVTEGVISYGYYGSVMDIREDLNLPVLALYHPLSILDLRLTKVNGVYYPTQLVVSEMTETRTDDPFLLEEEEQLKSYELDPGGLLVIRTWRKSKGQWSVVDETQPSLFGRRVAGIPYYPFVNYLPDRPPLLDLAYLNIKHFQVSVDYFHGLHWCGLPTPIACGFETQDALYIGCKKAWQTTNPDAQAYFLEFEGQGLGAVEGALKRLETQAAVIGARLIEQQRPSVETAEGQRIRASGDLSVLMNIATSLEICWLRLFQSMHAMWRLSGKPKVTVNKDFIYEKMDSQTMLALLKAMQSGAISLPTFIWNLQQGEMIPDNRTVDDELKAIDKFKDRMIDGNGAGGKQPTTVQ